MYERSPFLICNARPYNTSISRKSSNLAPDLWPKLQPADRPHRRGAERASVQLLVTKCQNNNVILLATDNVELDDGSI